MKSCETISTGPEDGPEEGEIVSDDLEDISDESIIFTPCSNGKFLSRSDHLNALSLSSVTDFEDFPVEKPKKRKKSYCPRHAKRRKRTRRKLVESDSSDEDDTTLDRRLQLQLKAAVRVDEQEAHKNSLRTRLRAMVNPHGEPEPNDDTTEPKDQINKVCDVENAVCSPEKAMSIIDIDSGTDSIVSVPDVLSTAIETISEPILSAPESGTQQPRDDIDSELIQLRLEALKTAINNKYRKKRKKDNTNITASDDTNKENTNNNGESSDVKTENKVEVPTIVVNEPEIEPPSTPEEDEDVLRALLLASMSKKITNIVPEPPTITKIQVNPIATNIKKITLSKNPGSIHNFKLNNVRKVVNNVKNFVNKASGNIKLIKMPQVKPLIINVNSDSDSDLDLSSSSPEKSPKKLHKDTDIKPVENEVAKNLGSTIESSVDKFLREQRAKVESEIQNVNKASLELVNNLVETQKPITTKSVPVVGSETTLEPTVMTKNTQFTKNVALQVNKINPNAIKPITDTNKNTQNLRPTNKPEKPKNIKIADLEKSALKFLPENKREEYKHLQNMLKLRKAQLKKPRIRRASQRVSESNNAKSIANKIHPVSNKNHLITKPSTQGINKGVTIKLNEIILSSKNSSAMPVVSKSSQNNSKFVNKTVTTTELTQKKENASLLSKVEARSQERRHQQSRVEVRNQERKSDALLLHATLKQMQTRIDGRLQIQERYKSLRPLIKKINDVSKEQRHWDQEVKRLLEQLAEVRKKQQDVHQCMSTFVKELAERKQRMDESPAKDSNKPKVTNIITSTPFKQNTSLPSLDISAVNGPSPAPSPSPSTVTLTNQISNINTEKTVTDAKKKLSKDVINSTWEQSTELNIAQEVATPVKRVASDTEFVVVDPNDIDKVIRKTVEKVAVLEKKVSFECRRSEKVRYVSPLDTVKRKEEFDPFAIMCPFEVNGTCKDSECTFRHLPK